MQRGKTERRFDTVPYILYRYMYIEGSGYPRIGERCNYIRRKKRASRADRWQRTVSPHSFERKRNTFTAARFPAPSIPVLQHRAAVLQLSAFTRPSRTPRGGVLSFLPSLGYSVANLVSPVKETADFFRRDYFYTNIHI